MEMEANDEFYFGRPKIDRLILAVIPSGDATQIAMQRGEIDVTVRGGVTSDAAQTMLLDPRFDVYATQGTVAVGFGFNQRHDHLKDVRLRAGLDIRPRPEAAAGQVPEWTGKCNKQSPGTQLVPEAGMGRCVPVRPRQVESAARGDELGPQPGSHGASRSSEGRRGASAACGHAADARGRVASR